MAAIEPTVVHRDLSRVPARVTAGIRDVLTEPGRVVHEMEVPPWVFDAAATVVPGALAIIADSALGSAVMSTAPLDCSMVTTHLHLELVQPVPSGTSVLLADGRRRWLRDRFGFGEGDIVDSDGALLAKASIGSLLLDERSPAPAVPAVPAVPAPPPSAPESPPPTHPLLAGAPVHHMLGTDVVEADQEGVRISALAHPQLANSSGGVHGGVGVLIGERALEVALRALDGSPQRRLVELRAAFLRPIRADGRRIEGHASIAHLGRRLAAGRSEVRDQDGRVAVLVDATYISV